MIRLSAVPHKEARTTIGLEGTPFLIFLIYSNCSPCSRCCLLPLVLLFLFPGSRLVKFSCFGKSQAKWFADSIMGEERTEFKKKKKKPTLELYASVMCVNFIFYFFDNKIQFMFLCASLQYLMYIAIKQCDWLALIFEFIIKFLRVFGSEGSGYCWVL